MNIISFPNLNLTFDINPVAISIGSVQIYWYGILITFALFLSLFLCKHSKQKYGILYDDVVSFAVIMMFVGILCARLYYVLFHLDYYLKNPIEIIQIYRRRFGNLWWHYGRSYSRAIVLSKEKDYF